MDVFDIEVRAPDSIHRSLKGCVYFPDAKSIMLGGGVHMTKPRLNALQRKLAELDTQGNIYKECETRIYYDGDKWERATEESVERLLWRIRLAKYQKPKDKVARAIEILEEFDIREVTIQSIHERAIRILKEDT